MSENSEDQNSVHWKTVGLCTVVSVLLTASAIAGYNILGPKYITHEILNKRLGQSEKHIKDVDNKTTVEHQHLILFAEQIIPELKKVIDEEHVIKFQLSDLTTKVMELAGALEETAESVNFTSQQGARQKVLDTLAREFGSGDNERVAKLWNDKTNADNVTSFGDEEHKTLYAFFTQEKNFTRQ